MTAKVINLRQARKVRNRLDKRQTADENAVRHGRSKAERALEAAAEEKAERHLDGHKRDP